LPAQFLTARGVELEEVRREDIEAFIADQLARWKPATAANRYRSLRVFYGWLEAEAEIPVSPMAKMRPPAVPDQPVPLVREDAFRRLLEACAGWDFETRRDTAPILLLVDVGPRRAEVAGMRLTDLDFDLQVACARQGRPATRAAVRPQDRPGPRPLPPYPRPPSAC
jgi:integrase